MSEDRVSKVPVTAMLTSAPAVLMTATPAPSIMMSTPAAVHLAVAASVTTLDLNDRIDQFKMFFKIKFGNAVF